MKILNTLLTLCITIVVLSCNSGKKTAKETTSDEPGMEQKSYSLTKKWETDTTMTTVESVIYNKGKGVLYASCISGQPDQKDGVGFIAQVDLDGNVINNQWVTGIDAPKGMAIVGNSLFVTNIDEIVEIDIENGVIQNRYPVADVEFLNDADADQEGNVYVSAMRTNKLIKLSDGEVSVFMDSVTTPNGVFVEGNNLITAYWDEKKIESIDRNTMEVTEIAGGLENPDGVEAVGDGGYLVSSWNGKVNYVSPEGEVTVLLDTTGEEISAADIEFIPEKNLLLVPTFFHNTVAAYELVK